jgi:hypothetical protein
MTPLKNAISLSANKKIKNIIPIENKFLYEYTNTTYKGVKLKYIDNSIIDIECSEKGIGAIMWYFDFENKKFTSYINHDTKYYIIKNLE